MFRKTAAAAKAILNRPVSTAVENLAGLFSARSTLTAAEKSCLKLIKGFLPTDPEAFAMALEWFRDLLLSHHYSENKVKEASDFLSGCTALPPQAVLPQLEFLQGDQRRQLLKLLLLLGDFARSEEANALWEQRFEALAAGLGIDAATQKTLRQESAELRQRRKRVLRSGTGILLALGVIGVMLLTAMWLPSLLFGAILAFGFLPLEGFFEKHLNGTASPGKRSTRASEDESLTPEERQQKALQSRMTRAVTLTVGCVISGALVLVVAAGIGLGYYLHNFAIQLQEQQAVLRETMRSQGVPPPAAAAVATDGSAADGEPTVKGLMAQASNTLVVRLNELKEQFRNQPLIRHILSELAIYLQQEKAQQELSTLLLKKSGGILAFLGKFVGGVATLLLNLLLTVFFFSLLLGGLARFRNNAANAGHGTSRYLIQTIFNGHWLPTMSETAMRDGERVIREVFRKLRVWLRGYLTMISIDYCVYTTVFLLLGVPYAPIVGIAAGCAILLPYVGPVSSALLTVLVTLAVNGAATSAWQICGIIGIYLIHNGVVEQFFIYPWIIGEALELTTLETIIVVLLGGLLAGITGMIFALPTAAVIKYLIPQIYRCTGSRLRRATGMEGPR